MADDGEAQLRGARIAVTALFALNGSGLFSAALAVRRGSRPLTIAGDAGAP